MDRIIIALLVCIFFLLIFSVVTFAENARVKEQLYDSQSRADFLDRRFVNAQDINCQQYKEIVLLKQKLTQYKEMEVQASAYTDTSEECGKEDGITASGTQATEGITVAASSELPFGTQILIPSLGMTLTVEDRGSAIKGNKIDIFFDTKEEAIVFGRKNLHVIIKERVQ